MRYYKLMGCHAGKGVLMAELRAIVTETTAPRATAGAKRED